MARIGIGDQVRVALPHGTSKRGVPGISVMFFTSMEARFEGATGTVTEINPRGPYGIPLYLVDFRDHENRVAIPWQSQWFREEWLTAAGDRRPEPVATRGELAAADGFGATNTGGSS